MASDRAFYLFAFRIIGDFGATIAVPVVALAWTGNTLDAKWGTRPWLLVAGFVLAAAVTTVAIRRKAKAYGAEYERLIGSQTPDVKRHM